MWPRSVNQSLFSRRFPERGVRLLKTLGRLEGEKDPQESNPGLPISSYLLHDPE